MNKELKRKQTLLVQIQLHAFGVEYMAAWRSQYNFRINTSEHYTTHGATKHISRTI